MNIDAAEIVDQIQSQPAPATEGQAPTEPAPQAKPDERVSGRMEMLIKREQQALHRERAAKEYEQKLQDKLKLIDEFEQAKGGNSKKALELLGLSYDQLTQSVLKDGEIPAEVGLKKIEDRLNKFEMTLEEKEKKQEQDRRQYAEQQVENAKKNFQTEIGTYLSDNKDRYELIQYDGLENLVYDVIDEHYNRTLNPETGIGKVMSIKEAADKVEEHLEKKYLKSRELTKVKALWGAIPKATQEQLAKQNQTQNKVQTPPRTLTNNLSASPVIPRKTPLTDEERIQKAIAYAKTLRPSL